MIPATMGIENGERGSAGKVMNIGQTKSTDVSYEMLYIHDFM